MAPKTCARFQVAGTSMKFEDSKFKHTSYCNEFCSVKCSLKTILCSSIIAYCSWKLQEGPELLRDTLNSSLGPLVFVIAPQ